MPDISCVMDAVHRIQSTTLHSGMGCRSCCRHVRHILRHRCRPQDPINHLAFRNGLPFMLQTCQTYPASQMPSTGSNQVEIEVEIESTTLHSGMGCRSCCRHIRHILCHRCRPQNPTNHLALRNGLPFMLNIEGLQDCDDSRVCLLTLLLGCFGVLAYSKMSHIMLPVK